MQISSKYSKLDKGQSKDDAPQSQADFKPKEKKRTSVFSRFFSKNAKVKDQQEVQALKHGATKSDKLLKPNQTCDYLIKGSLDGKTSEISLRLTEDGKTTVHNLKDEPNDILDMDPAQLSPSELEDWSSTVKAVVVNAIKATPDEAGDGMTKDFRNAYNAVRDLYPKEIHDAIDIDAEGVTVSLQDQVYETKFEDFSPNVMKLAQIMACVVDATKKHCGPEITPEAVQSAFGRKAQSADDDMSNWNDKPMASAANLAS